MILQGLMIVSKPLWVTAVMDGDLLCLYRSVLVHDTDPVLQPVNEILRSHEHRIISSVTGRDDNMMFGEGIATVYRIGDKV